MWFRTSWYPNALVCVPSVYALWCACRACLISPVTHQVVNPKKRWTAAQALQNKWVINGGGAAPVVLPGAVKASEAPRRPTAKGGDQTGPPNDDQGCGCIVA